MDFKSLVSNYGLLQSFLAGAGIFAPDKQTSNFFGTLKWHVIVMIVLGAIGIIFLLTGLCLYLTSFMPLYQVCMIMGGVILALGVAVLLSRIFVFCMIKRKIKKSFNELYEDAKGILNEIMKDLKQPIEDHPKEAMIIAAIAGFIFIQKILNNHKS